LWCLPSGLDLPDQRERQRGAICLEIAGQSETWECARSATNGLAPAGEETDGSRLALIREEDEAARSRPLWQSHAKDHAADLLGVKLDSANRRHN
jgi:hypothetical protein